MEDITLLLHWVLLLVFWISSLFAAKIILSWPVVSKRVGSRVIVSNLLEAEKKPLMEQKQSRKPKNWSALKVVYMFLWKRQNEEISIYSRWSISDKKAELGPHVHFPEVPCIIPAINDSIMSLSQKKNLCFWMASKTNSLSNVWSLPLSIMAGDHFRGQINRWSH